MDPPSDGWRGLRPPETCGPNGTSGFLPRLSRSPHPYHRRRHGPDSDVELGSQSTGTEKEHYLPSPQLTPFQSGSDPEGLKSEDDGRARRKDQRYLNDSGTEADDESFGFLKGLPAPPARPRKGLRDGLDTSLDGVLSPLLTPSYLDDHARQFSPDPQQVQVRNVQLRIKSEDPEKQVSETFSRRRRAEWMRRASEIALVGTIGVIVLSEQGVWRAAGEWQRAELQSYTWIMIVLLTLYPTRLLLYTKGSATASGFGPGRRLRIPSSFDPAPFIYPATLPLLVALSIFPHYKKVLLPNIILSLSTLPTQLIPGLDLLRGYSTVHWFIASIPLIASENTSLPSKLYPPKPYLLKSPPPEGLHPETLASLYALHQAILPPLHYLTTTSLLPAELQILSIALINLLLHSSAPQAIILKALLWGGGLTVSLTCLHVLRWGLVLARVPRWRFKRTGHTTQARSAFLDILGDGLSQKARNCSLFNQDANSDGSDADEDGPPGYQYLKRADSLKIELRDSNGHVNAADEESGSRSAIEASKRFPFPPANDRRLNTRGPGRRRNTLPNFGAGGSPSFQPRANPSGRRKRSKSSNIQSYLSLTAPQATLRKWLYAAYVYIVIILTVLLGIRVYVGNNALDGHEPIGWAIGYMFGDFQYLRSWVIERNLEDWISFSSADEENYQQASALGGAEYIRLVVLGEANTRLLLSSYWLCVLAIGMATVLRLSSVVEVDTRRKVFHGMMVAMLLPATFIDPAFTALALTLVLAIFLILDLFRATQLPPLAKPLAYFLTPYVDGRDLRGPVVVSHIFLLIGCAIPLWLSLAGVDRTGKGPLKGWEVPSRDVSMVAGVVCVGMGDAAASLIGRRYGKRKWFWGGGKSLEGSMAFASAVTGGLMFARVWLRFGGWTDTLAGKGENICWSLGKAVLAACGASFTEAVLTGGNDNVIVPIVLWLLTRGLRL
ncbi:MAG: hypothetical protein M1819_002748 [Sarea resinae]|nr:MAG: hypothetical protein M1819_002748 [Sarea resinae]